MVKRAIVRSPGKSYCNCISSHPEHNLLNLDLALEQHREYVRTLSELGLDVIELAPHDELPDACFVEDTVVVHRNKALMTRPNPISRRGEIESVGEVLKDYFEIFRVEAPATLEGGDVINFNDYLISGITQRTSADGVQQMRDSLSVRIEVVEDSSIVHLKSYVTRLEENKVVGIARYSNHPSFMNNDFLVIPHAESYASNTLTINGTVLMPQGYSETMEILKERGYDVIQLRTSEFARCEGALTCLSIVF